MTSKTTRPLDLLRLVGGVGLLLLGLVAVVSSPNDLVWRLGVLVTENGHWALVASLLLFAPGWRRARVLTDAEFSELRYSGAGAVWLRGVRAVLFGVVFNAVVVAMVLFAAGIFARELAIPNAPDWLLVGGVVHDAA